MKLIQANIWGGRLEKQVNKFLKDQNADIICLQEVNDVPGGETSYFTSLDEIRTHTNSAYVFSSPVFNFKFMRRVGKFGNVILSKYPFLNTKTLFTRLQELNDFDFKEDDDYNVHNLQHAEVMINNRLVHILNHHGHHVNQHKNGDSETMRQCRMIADYISKLKGPVILTGDFNLSPHSDSLKQINLLLTNLSIKYKLTTTRTPLTHKTEVCDYIFVSKDVKVKSFNTSDEIISDHKPLILEFDI